MGIVISFIVGAVLGAVAIIFVARNNPKAIASAEKIKEAYDSIKDI